MRGRAATLIGRAVRRSARVRLSRRLLRVPERSGDPFKIEPSLNFAGQTQAAFLFYRSVPGGEFTMLQRFSDTPVGTQVPESDRHLIMHIAMPLSAQATLMGTDALESQGQTAVASNNVHLSITPESRDQGAALFAALCAGGTVKMPFEKAFWGACFGHCIDKSGISWMVNFAP